MTELVEGLDLVELQASAVEGLDLVELQASAVEGLDLVELQAVAGGELVEGFDLVELQAADQVSSTPISALRSIGSSTQLQGKVQSRGTSPRVGFLSSHSERQGSSMAGQFAPEIQQRLDAYRKAAEEASAADQEQETAAGALAEAERAAYQAGSKALTAHRKESEAARELIEQWTAGPGGPPQKPGK